VTLKTDPHKEGNEAMNKSILSALGLAVALAFAMPALGNAATTTTTAAPAATTTAPATTAAKPPVKKVGAKTPVKKHKKAKKVVKKDAPKA
jgi:hypothetical protein